MICDPRFSPLSTPKRARLTRRCSQMPSTQSLTQTLQGKQIAHASIERKQCLSIHFSDGATLVVEARGDVLVATVKNPQPAPSKDTSAQPTPRQLEYLGFIARYIAHFGRSPAESDIQRHFFVSAPSVNQMMQTLERRGFIARQAGVARSIQICVNLSSV